MNSTTETHHATYDPTVQVRCLKCDGVAVGLRVTEGVEWQCARKVRIPHGRDVRHVRCGQWHRSRRRGSRVETERIAAPTPAGRADRG